MYSSTYLKWFRRLLILGAVVAGLTASAAGARLDPGTPPDVSDVASSLSVTSTDVSRPPDVRDAATSSNVAIPDAIERYVMAHPYGYSDVSSSVFVSSPPDVQDAAAALQSAGAADTVSPPDVQDAAAALGVDPLAESYLRGQGLSASQVKDWTVGACSYREKPASCLAGFQDASTALRQVGTPTDPVTRIRAQERGRRLDQGLFATPTTIQVVQSGGFDWGDWAIGIGTGMGLALMLGAGLLAGRQQRHRVQPV